MADTNTHENNGIWGFTNVLAFTVVLCFIIYLFIAAFVLSKSDVKDNTTLSQITTGVLNAIMLILAFYFGSSSNARHQQVQIAEMQKTATTLALNKSTANAAADENKVDKLVRIEEINRELEKYPPDAPEALKLLKELKELEKKD